MLTPEPMEIGLVFWAEQDADSTLRQLDPWHPCWTVGRASAPPL